MNWYTVGTNGTKNFRLIFKGKPTCRPHRKSPKNHNENSRWTAGAISAFSVIQ
jgi:hypothetical protein